MIPEDVRQELDKMTSKQAFCNEAFKLKIAQLTAKVDTLLELAGVKEPEPETPEEEDTDADNEADEF